MQTIYKQAKRLKSRDHLIRYRKCLWQNPTPFHNKSPGENRYMDKPQHNKGNLQQAHIQH